MGLPSSSFEFVPVLFDYEWISVYFCNNSDGWIEESNTLKYSEIIWVDNVKYLLTNYRALIYDVENIGLSSDILKHFNTEEECEIIKQHFKVFKYNVDIVTRSQMVRHRVNWQELSRRYVSGKKIPFEFYVSEKMKDIKSKEFDGSGERDTEYIISMCLEHYYAALEAGVKPEEARRIIPQAAYTTAWCAFQPRQLESYFTLRLDKTAQPEIRLVSEAMKSLVENNNG